jgi:hypothetical protein
VSAQDAFIKQKKRKKDRKRTGMFEAMQKDERSKVVEVVGQQLERALLIFPVLVSAPFNLSKQV